jgi:hypothetical protein
MEAVTPVTTPNFAERQRVRRSPDTLRAHQFPLAGGPEDRLVFYPLFGGAEVVTVPRMVEDHGGGDERLIQALLHPETPDPLGHRAGTRAGAYSILTGIAARESIQRGLPVRLEDLIDLHFLV